MMPPGLSTPPAEMAGLGPFVLQSYEPGQRLVLARNTRDWRTDAAGVPLPYLGHEPGGRLKAVKKKIGKCR
ncbi:MAG: hypothetical protein DSY84_01860 [Candidatus Neomarinimicrobiota bacterium]|jgi:ABC-type transport system substrate-binding protein|nr:MAG: hypothetical protein DSY84_01860 [Candidatus Neomarinimicrobiota bacterium]HIM52518.1 hypothetical protein [Acidobacteriota bacterium]